MTLGRIGEFTILRPVAPFLNRDFPGVTASLVSYFSGELAISACLYQPPENFDGAPSGMHPLDMPAPDGGAIVVGHGGIGGIPAHYDFVMRRLAGSGWHVAASNYRGEMGSDGEIEFAKGEVDDTITLWKNLTSLPGVDPAKTWLVGSSHGAMASLLALASVENPGIPGAVALAGVYDMVLWFDWIRQTNHFLLHDAEFSPVLKLSKKELKLRSVVEVADKIDAPVYLFHGSDDSMVPPGQSEILANRFADSGKNNYRMLIELGEDHEYMWGPDRSAAIRFWDEALRFIESN